MSGIGFQKLQGQGTTAHEQLTKLGELIEGINKLNYPDIYKQARMFAPELELIPIERKWSLPQSANGDFAVNLEGRYFGYWTLSHRALNVATANNNWQRTVLRLYDGSDVIAMNSRDTHGDDILTYAEHPKQIMGFGTSFVLSCSRYMSAECSVSFYGFRLGEREETPEPPVDPQDPEEPVTLSFQLFSNSAILPDGKVKLVNEDVTELYSSGETVITTLTHAKISHENNTKPFSVAILKDGSHTQYHLLAGEETDLIALEGVKLIHVQEHVSHRTVVVNAISKVVNYGLTGNLTNVLAQGVTAFNNVQNKLKVNDIDLDTVWYRYHMLIAEQIGNNSTNVLLNGMPDIDIGTINTATRVVFLVDYSLEVFEGDF